MSATRLKRLRGGCGRRLLVVKRCGNEVAVVGRGKKWRWCTGIEGFLVTGWWRIFRRRKWWGIARRGGMILPVFFVLFFYFLVFVCFFRASWRWVGGGWYEREGW